MESFFVLNAGQMAGPSANSHSQNVSSHTINQREEHSKGSSGEKQ